MFYISWLPEQLSVDHEIFAVNVTEIEQIDVIYNLNIIRNIEKIIYLYYYINFICQFNH